jgi:hypothetical protein
MPGLAPYSINQFVFSVRQKLNISIQFTLDLFIKVLTTPHSKITTYYQILTMGFEWTVEKSNELSSCLKLEELSTVAKCLLASQQGLCPTELFNSR